MKVCEQNGQEKVEVIAVGVVPADMPCSADKGSSWWAAYCFGSLSVGRPRRGEGLGWLGCSGLRSELPSRHTRLVRVTSLLALQSP